MLDRVLMTADTVGGVWNFALELSAGLCARSVEVMLASLGGEPREDQRAEALAIRGLRLRTSGYKLEWMQDPWADVEASAAWLSRLAEDFQPDVVHLNSFGHGSVDWRVPAVLTAHSCVASWWAAVRGGPLPASWARYRDEVKRALQSADLVTAPSCSMLRSLSGNYGVELARAHVVPNGRSAARYRATAKEPFVLTAGRLWDEAKNVAAVARVANTLEWPVYVAGDRGGVDLGVCRALGRLSAVELAAWLGRASIYALPARYEPFGLSALEAALSGCALVLGDIESLREIWGDAALYVAPDDHEALAASLRRLMESDELRQEFAHRASLRARHFSTERMVEGYLGAYGELVGRRGLACAS
jgi:glycogen(starch) synthase